MYKGQIPFSDLTGHPMYFPDYRYEWKYQGQIYRTWPEIERSYGRDALNDAERITVPPEWRPNEPFRAVMKIVSMSRGRSAANFDLEDENGIPYTMFMTDLLKLLQEYGVKEGKTDRLEWCFCKRGQNYGIQVAR